MKLYWRVKKESDTSPGVFYWTWERANVIDDPARTSFHFRDGYTVVHHDVYTVEEEE